MLDDDIKIIRSKVVKTRKQHNCFFCNKTIDIGEKAKLDVVTFYGGKPENCYSCCDKCKKEDLELKTKKQINTIFQYI